MAEDQIADTRVLFFEDDQGVGDALKHRLEHFGFLIVGLAATVEHAKQLIEQDEFEIALLDLWSRREGRAVGIELISIVKQRRPQAKIVVLTNFTFPDGDFLRRA